MVTAEEAEERRAREKLLSRRKSARAAATQTTNRETEKVQEKSWESKKKKKQQQQQQPKAKSQTSRDKNRMSSRGEMYAGRDRYYRDEFGREPQRDYRPRHREIPPGRWERDRATAPRRGRSPIRRHYRDIPRSRRSHESDRSYSSRSRSFSSRDSSFSSSESDRSNYRSDDSRSRSPSSSRSRSYSRSPSPKSPVEKKKEGEKADTKTIKEQKQKDDIVKKEDPVVDEKSQKVTTEDRNAAKSPVSPKENKRRSRSRSRSVSDDSRLRQRGRVRKRKSSRKNRSRSRSRSHSSHSSRSRSPYSDASSHYSRRRRERKYKRRRKREKRREDDFSKDQRTIFVSQLVMRTTERDLKKYFKRKVGCKVNDVILLRDRRNSRNHKGCAYVEVGRIEDVATALAVSGQPPDFQRFPILIKASEAEKNYASTTTTKMDGSMNASAAVSPTGDDKQATSYLPPLRDESGRLIESQKIYVGGLDPSIREDHLYALFAPFGNLKKVQLQYHPNTQLSRGYAFLTFYDPKVSHLAIQTMAGKIVTGRPLKTGWANQNQQSVASKASGYTVVTSDQFPDNASELTQKALSVLAQMTGVAPATQQQPAASTNPGVSTVAEQELDKAMGYTAAPTTTSTIPTVAEARASMATSMGATVADARASLAADAAARQLAAATAVQAAQKSNFIGNGGPTRHLLVHNMYDKDEETDPGWEVEIKEEFVEEASKFGKIEHAKVMHLEPGGKIFATFADLEGAKTCAENLAGRWFDKRQLRVDYMPEANPP